MKNFPNGVYPTMITPFTDHNTVDYQSLDRLIEWYLNGNVAGLFAVCQSSEMFYLSKNERVAITRFVKNKVGGRVPVVASGHVSESLEDQADELNAIAEAGADCLILVTNRLAKQDESDEVWLENLIKLMDMLPQDIPLGFYECPYPYKRIISPELLKWCANTGRFYFLKDTSCDVEIIREKLEVIKGTQLKLFNANSATLLETLKLGAAGYSGVMAGFHPDLYSWLCSNFDKEPDKAQVVSDFLSITALIERQVYPVNVKFYHQSIGNLRSIYTRVRSASELNAVAREEVRQLVRLTERFRNEMGIHPAE